jgi:hypothetical protein
VKLGLKLKPDRLRAERLASELGGGGISPMVKFKVIDVAVNSI